VLSKSPPRPRICSTARSRWYFERTLQAEPYFQKALAINPRASVCRAYYGILLGAEGRADEAVAQTTLACQMDLLSPFIHALAGFGLYMLARFCEVERLARHSLELQPSYLPALWIHGMALCGLGRNEEAIETLGLAVTISRAPIFVGLLGLACARSGRLDDTARLLQELEDRSSRGEYVPAHALLSLHVGRGDLQAIRRTLSKGLAEAMPPVVVRGTSGPFLEAYRSDPEVKRLLIELYGR
jgi:tetratricopeptide (TPR) repeat protein